MPEKFDFFPRDLTFWLYHWVCLSLLVFSQAILAAFFHEEHFVFNLLGFILWLPLFTVAALSFRYLYKKRQWSEMSMSKLIPLAFFYALLSGFAATTLILLSMMPLFLSNYYVIDSFHNTSVPYLAFASRLVSLNTLQSQLFMSAWIFIYVSVTSNRAIKEADSVNLRLENSLKEARISSLSNQLNPHLLFNTLNNIRFMIYENPASADDMITSLSDILRYSLKKSMKEKVTLKEEWEVVQRYLKIVRIQADDRIDFDLSIDEDLSYCLIPPMMLQMLVENAIKHGIERVKGGTLTLKVYEKDDNIFVEAVNTVPATPVEASANTGTGLVNIKQRLHLLYGTRAGLQIITSADLFRVLLWLPIEES